MADSFYSDSTDLEEDPRIVIDNPVVQETLKQQRIIGIYAGAKNGKYFEAMNFFESKNQGLKNNWAEAMSAIFHYENIAGQENSNVVFDQKNLALFGINPEAYETIRKSAYEVASAFVKKAANIDEISTLDSSKVLDLYKSRLNVANTEFRKFCSANNISSESLLGKDLWNYGISKSFQTQGFKTSTSLNTISIIQQELRLYLNSQLKALVELDPVVSFDFLREGGAEYSIIQPTYQDVFELNRRIQNGGRCYIFCCPDYEREMMSDGTYKYTMNSLSDGTGLTFERMKPLIERIVENSSRSVDSERFRPIQLRIGVADHEATSSNSKMVGLSDSEEGIFMFEEILDKSISSMITQLTNTFREKGFSFEIENKFTESDNPIKERKLIVKSNSGSIVSEISLGRVSTSFDNVTSKADFMDKILDTRHIFTHNALEAGSPLQTKVDKVMAVRLNLMLNWANEFGLQIPQGLSYSEYMSPAEKQKFVEDLKTSSQNGDEDAQEFLTLLRQKIAAQGAEYFVMARLMSHDEDASQILGDSATIWDVFGDPSLLPVFEGKILSEIRRTPRLKVKGNYIGD